MAIASAPDNHIAQQRECHEKPNALVREPLLLEVQCEDEGDGAVGKEPQVARQDDNVHVLAG
jgi:hypothetical protein